MEQRDLMTDLRELIHWMQDYERYGGIMTPPRAYEILVMLEACRDKILSLQGEIDILETKARGLELGR